MEQDSREQVALKLVRKGAYTLHWQLFNELAEEGLPHWEVFVGWLLMSGNSDLRDLLKAKQWLSRAAQRNFSDGYFYLAEIAELERNDTLARDLYVKAAGLGNIPACYRLGLMYAKYGHDTMDRGAALKWIQEAAKHGHKFAQILAARQVIAGRQSGSRVRAVIQIICSSMSALTIVMKEGREQTPFDSPLIRT